MTYGHLRDGYRYTGISSGPNARCRVLEAFTFYLLPSASTICRLFVELDRSQILDDRSLKIERARASDDGVYVCRAESTVGWHEAEAKLTVHC